MFYMRKHKCYIFVKLRKLWILQAGELIARLDLDDPSAVRKAEPFHGSFPVLGPPTAISGKIHQRCAASLNAALMILAGYEHNFDEVSISLSHSNLVIGIKLQ